MSSFYFILHPIFLITTNNSILSFLFWSYLMFNSSFNILSRQFFEHFKNFIIKLIFFHSTYSHQYHQDIPRMFLDYSNSDVIFKITSFIFYRSFLLRFLHFIFIFLKVLVYEFFHQDSIPNYLIDFMNSSSFNISISTYIFIGISR